METTAAEWIEQHKDKENSGFGYVFDGCHYDLLSDVIQCGMLDFCGCGSPEENLKYICDGLEYIDWRINSVREIPWEEIKKKEIEIFGNEQSAYFFYYWASKEGYTEHGGSVPGWLDKKGKLLIELIKIAEAEGLNEE